MKKTYFNLSCGIEGLPAWRAENPTEQYGYIRIQSTALEQKRWAFVINDLDHDFLFNLAIGTEVEVVDFSSQKDVPRALYQGIPWIRYVLNRFWYGYQAAEAMVRGYNVACQFERQYRECEKEIKMKLKYYRKYIDLSAGSVNLQAVDVNQYTLTKSGQAKYDGRDDQALIYRSIAVNHQ